MSGHDPAALVRPQEPALARLDDDAHGWVGTRRGAGAVLAAETARSAAPAPPRRRLRVVRDTGPRPGAGRRTCGG